MLHPIPVVLCEWKYLFQVSIFWHILHPALFSHRHRLPEVPLPTVCQVQPLSPLLHWSRSEDIHLQLLEWWEFNKNIPNLKFKYLYWSVWILTSVFEQNIRDVRFGIKPSPVPPTADPHHRDLYVNSSDYLALLNNERANPNATGQHIVAPAFL